MRIADVVKALKDRQAAMESSVFQKPFVSEVEFAKSQGKWLGLGDAIAIIAEQMKKEQDD
jgi:hypothetical protein